MTTPHVLVAYGSTHGSTAELAAWVADALRGADLFVDVAAASEVRDVSAYDAVVVGGALYVGRWHRDARRFVRRFAAELRERPVWLFSSGPLDDSADAGDLPMVPGLAKLARSIGARGHATFGGSLPADVDGFLARMVAKRASGDYRRIDLVRAWAEDVASAISQPAHRKFTGPGAIMAP